MHWKWIDLDAVLYALFKTMEDMPPGRRKQALTALFHKLGEAAVSEKRFTIEIEAPGIDPDYQRVVDQVRARRVAEKASTPSDDGLLHDRPPTTGQIIPGKSRRITNG